jgi:hypothetical protein
MYTKVYGFLDYLIILDVSKMNCKLMTYTLARIPSYLYHREVQVFFFGKQPETKYKRDSREIHSQELPGLDLFWLLY